MKKLFIFIICFILCFSEVFLCSAAFTSSFEVDAEIAYVISADEDSTVIYNKNSAVKCNPGELVKIVTGLLVIENCSDLGTIVTASADAIRSIEKLRVTTAGILVGEMMTVEELLYCLCLCRRLHNQ